MKINIYLILFSCLFLFNCKKDKNDDVVNLKNKVSKEYFHKNVDQVRVFSYNNDGTLKSYEYQFNGTTAEVFNYFYKDKILTSIQFYSRDIHSQPLSLNESIDLKYQNGKISEIQRSALVLLGGNVPAKYVFSYGSSVNNFDSCKVYAKRNNTYELINTYSFQYDNNENIVEEVYEGYSDGELVSTFTSEFQYDNKKNPKYKLDNPFDFVSYFSPNNCVSSTSKNEEGEGILSFNRTYEYNSDLLPVKFTEINSNNQAFPSVRDYEYN